MIESSPLTRVADYKADLDNEAGLEGAVSWLRTHTHLRRLGFMEVCEAIRQARAGGFVITLPETR